MENLNYHEKNIVDVALRIIEKGPLIKFNHPEEKTSVHISKKICIDNIKKYFVLYLKRYVENPDHLISIRWFYTQKLLDIDNIDPLIPYNHDDNEGLYYELEKINVPFNEIEILINNVYNMIDNFIPKIINDTLQVNFKNNILNLKYGPLNFNLTEAAYEKLLNLYQGPTGDEYLNIFNLLCRYEALASPSYHLSIPTCMMKLLKEHLHVSHQLFASPFNCDVDISYTSAYPDTDKFFGSKGNFYNIYPELFLNGGSFEANPPFLEEHMAALSILIERTLEKSKPFSFIIVYPTWEDAISFNILKNSKYNILHNKVLNFNQKCHNYDQSCQYWHIGVGRKSYSKSSIFILQNELGSKKYPVSQQFIIKLKQSFNMFS